MTSARVGDPAQLDPELSALIADAALAPSAVTSLTRLAHATSPTRAWRIEASGVSFKGVLAWRDARAATIEEAIAALRAQPALSRALPPLLARRGRALLFTWIDGAPADDACLDDAARLLGRIHASAPAGLVSEERLTVIDSVARLEEDADAIVRVDLLGRAAAARIIAHAREHAVGAKRAVFVHTDLCPENLVMRADDHGLALIDQGSWAIGPEAWDVARAWWRWPAAAAELPRFIANYRDALVRAPELESLPFWIAVAAVSSTAYRVRGNVPLLAQTRERLGALAHG